MKPSIHFTLFLLIPLSFILGVLGPACSPEAEEAAGFDTEVGDDGRVRKIEDKSGTISTWNYNDDKELTEITWDDGSKYSCNSTGSLINSIRISSAYVVNCTYDANGNLTSYVDDQTAFRSACDIDYVNSFPSEIKCSNAVRQNDGTYDESDIYLISNILASSEGLSSADICVYNGSSECFQEFDAVITCTDIPNPFLNNGAYTSLLPFTDYVYNLTKFSPTCVSKVQLTNTDNQDTYEITYDWSADQNGKVTGVVINAPGQSVERTFTWY